MRISVIASTALAALAAAQDAKPFLNDTSNPLPALTQLTPVIGFRKAQHGHAFALLPLFKDLLLLPGSKQKGALGQLVLNNAHTNFQRFIKTDFAATPCDPENYKGQITLSQVINNAIDKDVKAIIFYSTRRDYCNLTDVSGFGDYNRVYTVYPVGIQLNEEVGANGRHFETFATKPSSKIVRQSAGIYSYKAYNRYANATAEEGGSSSTAVAMIILYSITGVITALFLIIIVTGAIRAHRHPERYGPRSALGRSRQSRAKGIARAMLDTIPIVKFSGNEQQFNKDVENHELENRDAPSNFYPPPDYPPPGAAIPDGTINAATPASAGGAGGAATAQNDSAEHGTSVPDSSSPRSLSKTETDRNHSHPHTEEDHLGCSICTDDFEIGQDIRVLPCGHKFHPACVDPWLLEVSGTCPLCRVNLQPQNSQGDDAEATDELPPPLNGADTDNSNGGGVRRRGTLRAFVSSRLPRRNLHGASAEERIEVLRRWREANTQNTSTAGVYSEPARQNSANGSATEGEEEEQQRRGNSRLSALSRLVRRRDRS